MDELELLKKDWKENKSDDFKNYTEKELFAMTKKGLFPLQNGCLSLLC